jgi:hypothetical protein
LNCAGTLQLISSASGATDVLSGFRAITLAGKREHALAPMLFAVLFWMVAIWRAIRNKTANSYRIEIAM